MTDTRELTDARAARLAARRERRLARLRREILCLAIFGTVWLGFATWYFAKGHPVGWGYVGTFVVYEVLNYVRGLRKLAE